MSFAKTLGSKYGQKFLNKDIFASKRFKDTASKFSQSKYGKMLKITDLAKGLNNKGSEFRSEY